MSSIVPYKQPETGAKHQHNFQNRYIPTEELRKPSKDVTQAIQQSTKQEINRIVGVKTEPAYVSSSFENLSHFFDSYHVHCLIFKASTVGKLLPGESQFIKYTPNQQGNGLNSGAGQRIIKMQQVQVDPLQPPRFEHKRIPKGQGSPPPTIMHSPPRKLTVKDQQDWKIPPCISNWKNAKGYTIPLEMRLSADGRTLQQHTVNDRFAKLSDTFYIVERQARKEIEERNQIQKTMAYKEYMKQEERMKEAAAQARIEKNKILEQGASGGAKEGEEEPQHAKKRVPDSSNRQEEEAKKERDMFRYIAKREVERDHRLDVARNKKSKGARDADRDVSEKIALGMAQPTASAEVMYDQRLFNQSSGLDTGFADEDEYNVYDKPLFQDKVAASIYNNKEYDDNIDEDDAGAGAGAGDKKDKRSGLERIMNKAPERGFEGAERKGPRSKPVEFEKHVSSLLSGLILKEEDLFALGSFIGDEGKKKLKTE